MRRSASRDRQREGEKGGKTPQNDRVRDKDCENEEKVIKLSREQDGR